VLTRQLRKLKITEEHRYGKLNVENEPLKAAGAMVAYYESEIRMKQMFIEELMRKKEERA
jgi:hypothetical protein